MIWVPDYFKEFSKCLLPEAEVFSLSELKYRYDQSKPTKTTKWNGEYSPMKTHTIDYAFMKLCDESPTIEHKNYLKIGKNIGKNIGKTDGLPDKYVVITTGYTANVREFPAKSVNEIAQWLLTKDITPVYLGQTQTKTGTAHIITGTFSEEIDYSLGISLVDKTSLLDAAGIMAKAKAVIGVDNGLLHVAGCTDVPIVGGFTTVTPQIRMPIRNNVLGWNFYPVVPEGLDCSFCQEKTNFLYGHDYRNCMHKHRLCVSQMTSEKFIKELEKCIF